MTRSRVLITLVMDIHTLLQTNCTRLLEQYHSNLKDVLSLQATLINDILPGLEDELNLDTDSAQWAKEWLEDTCERFAQSMKHL